MKGIISFFFFLISLPAFPADDLRIISSDQSSIVFEFSPLYDTSSVTINHEKFISVTFFEGETFNPGFFGAPSIPIKKLSVGVPSESGNTIQIISSDYKEIQGRISPVPKLVMSNNMTNYVYEINERYNSASSPDLISFGAFGTARGLPVQIICIAPVQFNNENKLIRLYTKIIFRVNYSADKKVNSFSVDDNLLKDAVLNYTIAKNWIKKENKLNKVNQNSVLSSGTWYTFEAPDEGIYKIERNLLPQLGIDPSTVNPKTIKIYNNGGKDLPENLKVQRPSDLLENAIYVFGEDDDKFDDGDYILFYGRGIHFWEPDTTGKVKRFYHTYSTKNLYWITSGGTPGKRMQLKNSEAAPAQIVQTTTKAYKSWEEDKAKIQPSGRLYLGDDFGENSTRTYMTNLDNIIPSSEIEYRFNFVNHSEGTASLTVRENDIEILKTNITGVGDMEDPHLSRGVLFTGRPVYSGQLQENRSLLKFNYNNSTPSSMGFLDFFEIYYDKYLKASAGELLFYSDNASGIIQYELSGFPSSGIKIFDVTNHANVKIINGEYISGGDCIFKASETSMSKYIAILQSRYKVPDGFKRVQNSNLYGITEGAQFIIITPKDFRQEAERLKQHKENNIKVKISTIVINVEDIFNEFSCGITDVCAIRDFLKHAYNNWQIEPEYVLLFGDGDYDYKNIEGKNQNFIIPYESAESYSYMDSYVSDDFFSIVESNDDFPDLAMGRLNILSMEDAKIIVDKIIRYETSKDFGLWKNLITFVADDWQSAAGVESEIEHTDQSEGIANIVSENFEQAKIYLSFYTPVQTATGRRKPAVNKAIVDAINNGTLIMSFIGHGRYDIWTHEYVFDQNTTIPQLKNDKLFFLTAATCDFGRYDRPGRENQSSTELLLMKPDGGSIGIFTSARTVYGSFNYSLSQSFYKNLMKRDTLNLMQPVGKSYYSTKLKRYEKINDLKFHLLCDPTLRLAAPEMSANIDSINNQTLQTEIQIKALSNITIKGCVPNSSYNGEVILSVYDSDKNVAVKEFNRFFPVQGGLIYRGRVSVIDGKFSTQFTVPKDISYENKKGKISAYIYNDQSDGIGFTKNIIIGGSDSTQNDGKGPELNIGFDQNMSENYYLVKPDFTLNVKLADQTGLNTTGTGIGHKLEGILNGDEKAPIDFTNFFVGDLNGGGKSGAINYNFNGIEQGDYTIEVKAWDVFNNFSSDQRNFTVVSGEDVVLRDVFNYPNPFAHNTTFTFQHNISDPIDIKISIYTISGRKIKVIEKFNILEKFVRIDWDGRDQDANAIANGTYLYKIIVKTADGTHKQEVLGKLAVVK